MPRFHRPLLFIVLVGAAFLAAGCGSNNKDKIIGKWKLLDSPEFSKPEAQKAQAMGVYVVVEFRPDETFTISLNSDQPGIMEFMKAGMPNGKTSFAGKYRLMSGDNVELKDLDSDAQQFLKPGRAIISINGDQMSIKTSTGVEKYGRMTATVGPQNKVTQK